MTAPMADIATKPRILTGDTPTGQLHLGHYVGSVKRRVELQDQYEAYILIANMHAFTTRSDTPDEIRRDCLEIVRDWLAMGLDPNRCAMVLQTEVPAIAELTYFFAMLLPFNRVMRNPTLKDEIKVKDWVKITVLVFRSMQSVRRRTFLRFARIQCRWAKIRFRTSN